MLFSNLHGLNETLTKIIETNTFMVISETYVKYTKMKKTAQTPRRETTWGDNSNADDQLNVVSHKSNESSNQNLLNKDERVVRNETPTSNEEDIVNKGSKMESIKENVDLADDTASADKIEVWGSQFDRKVSKMDNDTSEKSCKKEENKPSFLKNLGQKMYQQSLKLNKPQVFIF